ncbi:YceI family protein [Dokdonella sp.]|uniref:YceI family protein n=1 Tax=Dokdonella sp. TaxID=2291710 RepID=UPI0031C90C5D|nr:YceI family protein [Dokdonella sp.]
MLRRLAIAGALALATASVCAIAAPLTYELDPGHTQVVFRWSHFGFSHPSGQFGTVNGTLQFDPEAPTEATLSVTIPIASINTNVPELDAHLQKADFFDVARFPVATFKSTRVEQGAAKDRLKVTGDLSLHGVTRPLVLDVTINKIGKRPSRDAQVAGFDATTVIKRSDFGIQQYVPMISDDIDVRITTEAVARPATRKEG